MTADEELEGLLDAELPAFAELPEGGYVIYGAGGIGREVAAKLVGSGRRVDCFLDARATGSVGGLPIHSPTSEAARRLAAEGNTAVIGVFNQAADPWVIQTLLGELGFPRVISFNEFQEQLDLPPHFWLTGRRHVLEHRGRVVAAWSVLADDTSRRVFLEVMRLRLLQDLRMLRRPDPDQYLPHDLPQPRMPLRLIDGGAFTGDTLELFIGKGVEFEAVAAFEPDPESFRGLLGTSRRLAGRLGDTTLWPCGLSEVTSTATFSAGQGTSSAVTDHGEVHVQLVALDDVLPSFRPNYIKLDVEGSELAAIRGGAEMIRRHQPTVAACVYHRPEDLWEIPLCLRELLPTHRIALRHHAFQGFELIAYAVPHG